MAERPILFSAPMVRALLAGTKIQTRRIMKPQPPSIEAVRAKAGDGYHLSERGDPGWWRVMGPVWAVRELMGGDPVDARSRADVGAQWRCPYGTVGDRLWVRETWQYADWTEDGYPFVRYQADGTRLLRERLTAEWSERIESTWAELSEPANFDIDGAAADRRWRPSIHMPRWASRLTLEITGVRVERLQAITEADAQAEGVEPYTPPHGHISPEQRVPGPGFERARLGDQPHRLPFADLWCDINGTDSWRANPWVWALTFKPI